jgi:hypothetical protein
VTNLDHDKPRSPRLAPVIKTLGIAFLSCSGLGRLERKVAIFVQWFSGCALTCRPSAEQGR